MHYYKLLINTIELKILNLNAQKQITIAHLRNGDFHAWEREHNNIMMSGGIQKKMTDLCTAYTANKNEEYNRLIEDFQVNNMSPLLHEWNSLHYTDLEHQTHLNDVPHTEFIYHHIRNFWMRLEELNSLFVNQNLDFSQMYDMKGIVFETLQRFHFVRPQDFEVLSNSKELMELLLKLQELFGLMYSFDQLAPLFHQLGILPQTENSILLSAISIGAISLEIQTVSNQIIALIQTLVPDAYSGKVYQFYDAMAHTIYLKTRITTYYHAHLISHQFYINPDIVDSRQYIHEIPFYSREKFLEYYNNYIIGGDNIKPEFLEPKTRWFLKVFTKRRWWHF